MILYINVVLFFFKTFTSFYHFWKENYCCLEKQAPRCLAFKGMPTSGLCLPDAEPRIPSPESCSGPRAGCALAGHTMTGKSYTCERSAFESFSAVRSSYLTSEGRARKAGGMDAVHSGAWLVRETPTVIFAFLRKDVSALPSHLGFFPSCPCPVLLLSFISLLDFYGGGLSSLQDSVCR